MSNQLTTSPRKDIRETLEHMKPQFAMALPKLVTADRFLRVALTCINKNPKLLACTRESLLACLLDCAQLGIEPDGRRAHLIPYGDKCTLIIDYKGLAELVRRSGEISTLHCGIVYPGDDFDYMFGTGQFLKHKPALERPDGVKPTCVYSYVKLKDGQEDFDVMSIADVQKVRGRSRASNNGPWVTDFDEMAKKTIFRRHSKWLPLSPELREKIEKDDEPLTEEERFRAAKTVGGGVQFGEAFPEGTTEIPSDPVDDRTADPLNRSGSDEPAGTPNKPKRTRRTKAEMAAAKEPAPTSERATPLQQLRSMIAASPLPEPKEENFRKFLVGKMAIEPSDTLEKLPIDKLNTLIEGFMAFAGEMMDGPFA